MTTNRRFRTTSTALVSSVLLLTACSGEDAAKPAPKRTAPSEVTEIACSAIDNSDLANSAISDVRAEPTGANSCEWTGEVDNATQVVASVNVLDGVRPLGSLPPQTQATPDPVEIEGVDVSWRASGLPSGVRLAALAGAWTVTVDVATGDPLVDLELAEKAMRSTIDRLEIDDDRASESDENDERPAKSAVGDTESRDDSDLWAVPVCESEPAEGTTVTPGPVPGGCTIATGTGTFNLAVSQPEFGTRDQVLAASITSTDANGAAVEWARRSVDVGDAATLLIDPTTPGVNGMLVVLDGERVLSISVNGTDDSAIDVALNLARASISG